MQQVDIYLYISSQRPRIPAAEYRYKLACSWGKPCPGEGKTGPTTGSRLALICAAEALGHMTRPAKITVHTDSRYLINGNSSLEAWKENGWKRAAGKPLKNQDLWEKIYDLQRSHEVRYIYDENVDKFC